MNAVVQFQAPRLPYAPVIEERFGELGVTKTTWKALTEAVWPNAKTVDGVVMALSYCQARKLDPFKKPVHIVPVWSSALGREVEGVWPGISELRTTAMRTGQYAGCDETEFGPDVTREFSWSDKRGAHKATVTFPEWARCTLYRMVGSIRVPFVGPKVKWLETYATASRNTDAPNDMWRKRPEGQIEKCAEAAALRKAFPEELGNQYAAEEMEGRVIGTDGAPMSTTVQVDAPKLHAGFDDDDTVPDFDKQTGEIIDTEVEEIGEATADGFPGDKPAPDLGQTQTQEQTQAEPPRQETTDQPKPTLPERVAAFRKRMGEATSSIKLKSIRRAADNLFDDMERADPEGRVELAFEYEERLGILEEEERAERSKGGAQ